MPDTTPIKPTRARPAGPALNANNLSIVVGELVSEPAWRELPSGTTALSCSVRIANPDGPATAVPVVWYEPPARCRTWQAGEQVIVAGAVIRRFFRQGGGGLGSATEIVVGRAERLSQRTRVDKLRASVLTLLDAAGTTPMKAGQSLTSSATTRRPQRPPETLISAPVT